MKYMEKIALNVPSEVLAVSSALKSAGFEAYFVGGCVRDLMLKREPKDWDITTNATPEDIQGLFTETFYENSYGTVGVVTESDRPAPQDSRGDAVSHRERVYQRPAS